MSATLRSQIDALVEKHGGLRAAGRAISIDPTYLLRLRKGTKREPSAKTLKKLGLKRVVNYVMLESR